MSALLPVPDLLTSSGVIGVHALCLAIRAAIWAFSSSGLLASFCFVSFSICNCLAFSACSLLFSFDCFSVSVTTFLACNTSFKSHFIAYLGISSLTILSISISSLSGTFCLCFLVLVLGFLLLYVVPPQSWGDRSDTKHSKCLLLGGRRLNQLTLIPKPKGSGGARAATAQVGPANKRNDTKRCLPVEASLRPGEAIPW